MGTKRGGGPPWVQWWSLALWVYLISAWLPTGNRSRSSESSVNKPFHLVNRGPHPQRQASQEWGSIQTRPGVSRRSLQGWGPSGDPSEGRFLILCGIHQHSALGSTQESPSHSPATLLFGKGGPLVVFNTQVGVKHLKCMRCGSGRNGALKALRGIRVLGYGGLGGVTGYPLVGNKEFLTMIALVRRLRLCEEKFHWMPPERGEH